MRQSDSLASFAKAFVKVQAALRPAVKDSVNPHFKSKYADLASVWDACRGPLTANGFSVIQRAEKCDTKVAVTTTLLHESGEFIESTIEMQPADSRPQSDGSAITYARRYALAAMVGVCPDDDDGNEASGRGEMIQQTNGKKEQKTNAVYLAMEVRMRQKLESEEGKILWKGGSKDAADFILSQKGCPFKTWAEVKACTDAGALEKVFEMFKREHEERVAALRPAGAI